MEFDGLCVQAFDGVDRADGAISDFGGGCEFALLGFDDWFDFC